MGDKGSRDTEERWPLVSNREPIHIKMYSLDRKMDNMAKISRATTGRGLIVHVCLFLLLVGETNSFQSARVVSPLPSFANGKASLPRFSSTTQHVMSPARTVYSSPQTTPTPPESSRLTDCNVAIVGAGPSGLLLAHKLLEYGAKVSLYERRARPGSSSSSSSSSAASEQTQSPTERTYALGLGTRGRTALQSVANGNLWKAIQKVAFASDRFDLHIGKLRLRLRKEQPGMPPSLLLFQSDLCRVMGQELQNMYPSSRLNVQFGAAVLDVDLDEMRLTTATGKSGSFDLIVGCDGVNSAVRESMTQLETTKELLPGEYKVARVSKVPPQLDPSAVALVLPSGKGGESGVGSKTVSTTTAFVEPTINGTCCILFAGRDGSDTLLSSQNVTELTEVVKARFPKLEGVEEEAARALAAKSRTSTASCVQCNTFHEGRVVLVGDSAHSTGGVSGQGVNSALMDSAALADAMATHYDCNDKVDSIRRALLSSSQQQYPEAKALYDLSFGPKPKSLRKRISYMFKLALDTLFQGKLGLGDLPLQTKLTTSLTSFSDIRRERDGFYDEDFPDTAYWNRTLEDLHVKMQARVFAANT